MKPTPVLILLCSVLLACGGRDDLRRDEKQYEVVQEGAAGTAASTIGGPGEVVPPPMPAMTGTNADTTTAFTLPMTATGTQAPPGSIAGTLPPAGGPMTGLPATPPSPRPSSPAPRPAPEPQPAPQPPAVQPPPVPPPSTDTTATQPAEEEQEEEEEEREPEPQPEPQPQPQPPPTPPPTTTDTTGTFS